MSEKQHTADIAAGLPHEQASGTEGGKCLNRHIGVVQDDNSCSHRWQGFKRAEDDHTLYDWPKYQGMGPTRQVVFKKAGEGERSFTYRKTRAPEHNEWDVGVTNKRLRNLRNHGSSSNVPYYHEAHHVLPNSVLRSVLQDLFAEEPAVLHTVREGLLNEGYNLNHKSNMILLPMDKKVSAQLGLPRHRELGERSHRQYSDKVEEELNSKLKSLRKRLANCEKAAYSACKSKLQKISADYYRKIVEAGNASGATINEL